MSLIDVSLQRRRQIKPVLPLVEVLEERQLLSVSAPSLQLAAVSSTQVKLTWTNVANENGYRIFRWDGTKTVLITTVAANVTQFTMTGLGANQIQWFTVEAFDFATTARSPWKSITTPADAIQAPTNLRVDNSTQTSIGLAWNNATGATGYRVYQWDGVRSTLLGTTTPTVPAFTVRNLTPGTAYYFYVQAFNATNTANSITVAATTLTQGLATPPNFKAQAVDTSTIALTWNDVAAETGYRVFCWDGSAFTNPVQIATLDANSTGFQATGLVAGKTYWFYVQAFNNSAFANTVWMTATTVAAPPLQKPTQVVVTLNSPGNVTLSWTEPARAVGYNVYVWTIIGWSLVSTVSAGTHSVPITGLMPNTTQWFLVQAFTDNYAEVANSNFVYKVV